MSNLGFKYGSAGLSGMSKLGTIEGARRELQAEQNAKLALQKGEGLGVLAGTLTREGQNAYDKRKSNFEKANPGQEYAILDDVKNWFDGWMS